MEHLSDEEKQKMEINKMFDLGEKVLMDYMCYYLKALPSELFNNIENLIHDELVLHPIDEYKPNTFLHFKLEIVPHDFCSTIPEQLKSNAFIVDALRFLNHAVQEVFIAIQHHNLKDEMAQVVLTSSIHFEFDAQRCSFKPVYIFPNRRQTHILSNCLDSLTRFYKESVDNGSWDTITEDVKKEWEANRSKTSELLESMQYNAEQADKKEEEANEGLETAYRIGVVFRESPVPQ